MTERKHSAPAILTAVLVLMLLLGAYVAGYFWLGDYDSGTNDNDETLYVSRDYGQQWLAKLYSPAGKLESWLRRIEVTVSGPDSGRL